MKNYSIFSCFLPTSHVHTARFSFCLLCTFLELLGQQELVWV